MTTANEKQYNERTQIPGGIGGMAQRIPIDFMGRGGD